jgi:hypothetical protein
MNMKREIHVGSMINPPDKSFVIDIPAVHLRNHLYDSLKDYAESSQNPCVYIPDTRILTPDSIRQFISFLRVHTYVNVIACARKEEDVPYLFKYVLVPIFHTNSKTVHPMYKIALERTHDSEYVELVAELTDLGFFTNPNPLYERILN